MEPETSSTKQTRSLTTCKPKKAVRVIDSPSFLMRPFYFARADA